MVIRPKRRATHCRAMATLCLMDPHVLTLDPAVHRCSRTHVPNLASGETHRPAGTI